MEGMQGMCCDKKSYSGRFARSGFTIIEMLIVLGIVMIIGVMATPKIGNWILKTRIETEASFLRMGLAFARAEAVTRRSRVFLQANNGDWNLGWGVFVDHDDSGNFTDKDELIKEHYNILQDFRLTWSKNGVTRYIFGPRGLPIETKAVTARFCPDDTSKISFAKGLTISLMGRSRIVKGSSVGC